MTRHERQEAETGRSLTGSADPVVAAAIGVIRDQTDIVPSLALVLGSGLNDLADAVEDPVAISTASLPGYPHTSVVGHRGRLVFGTLEDVPVLFLQGRVHAYEGHDLATVTLPVRLSAALGAPRILITNAAGGIRPGFTPGTLMWIEDHVDWVNRRPWSGDEATGRRPGAWVRPVDSPWDPAWLVRARELSGIAGVKTEQGTYLWTLGPSFETKAEIRAFAGLGADAVGMSTVPEALAARALGMKVLGLSTITNAAAGLGTGPLDHVEVMETGRAVRSRLEKVVRSVVADLAT